MELPGWHQQHVHLILLEAQLALGKDVQEFQEEEKQETEVLAKKKETEVLVEKQVTAVTWQDWKVVPIQLGSRAL